MHVHAFVCICVCIYKVDILVKNEHVRVFICFYYIVSHVHIEKEKRVKNKRDMKIFWLGHNPSYTCCWFLPTDVWHDTFDL